MKHLFTFFFCFCVLSVMSTVVVFGQTGTFSVQGVLRDPSGRAVDDGAYEITFKLYTVATNGTPLWQETQPSVQVNHGVFSAKVGSVTALPVLGNSLQYFIGFTVAGGSELLPRVELGRSFSALTAYSMVGDSNYFSGNGNVGIGIKNPTEKFEIRGNLKLVGASSGVLFNDGTTLNTGTAFIPQGAIIMWSGSVANLPAGWALCDGTAGRPNLKGRFIVGYDPGDTDYDTIGETGGLKSVTLTVNQMPSHSHTGTTSTDGAHTHDWKHGQEGDDSGGGSSYNEFTFRPGTITGATVMTEAGDHSHTLNVDNTGGGQAHENRPLYYTLAFLIKL